MVSNARKQLATEIAAWPPALPLRQPSFLRSHVQADLVNRVNLVNLVMRMLLSNASKEGRRQESSIRKTAPQLVDEDFDAPLSRCFFDEPNDRLNLRAEMDLVRWCF